MDWEIERVSPPVGVSVLITPTTRVLAGILKPLGKEGEEPMLIFIVWFAMTALIYWLATQSEGQEEQQ